MISALSSGKHPNVKFFVFLLTGVLLIGGAVVVGARTLHSVNRTVVPNFDLERYMGTWYEIARFDHSFERGIEAAKACYTLQPDGRVTVENSGVDARTGEARVAHGKAHATDVPGHLRVSFFWIFYSDYNVMELDPDYRWALVGSRSPNYLWILSRTPALPQETLDEILRLARARGYDTDKLIYVDQSPR
ncbi:MAG TPA: lipocalin family protein [Candidatus Alistipes intestinipullorum]|nr:lipocalin family protein [Candidatus Alistipes intestinipullorum]